MIGTTNYIHDEVGKLIWIKVLSGSAHLSRGAHVHRKSSEVVSGVGASIRDVRSFDEALGPAMVLEVIVQT